MFKKLYSTIDNWRHNQFIRRMVTTRELFLEVVTSESTIVTDIPRDEVESTNEFVSCDGVSCIGTNGNQWIPLIVFVLNSLFV